MRRLIKVLLVLAVVVAAGAGAIRPLRHYWRARHRIHYRTAEVVRGRIVLTVNSTGTVKPVLSVQIGAFVSGPIVKLNVNFNDRVKQGDVMARIDPRIYQAAVARDRAVLATRLADVKRAEALLQQAINDEGRARALQAENADFISGTEMDQFHFHRLSLEAQLAVAHASVEQAKANLSNSEANLGYTEIRAPVDGTVIDRKIDPGQTLAAQFQTPELFVVAPDMAKRMDVYADVDESEIGLVREAKRRGEPVVFTVEAYPGERFEGHIEQVRFSSTTTQNVVTYPVIVAAPNPDLKLLPGMTADLSFQIEAKDDVLKIPSAALRFYPKDRAQVRPADRKVLDMNELSDTDNETAQLQLSASQRAEAARKRNRHYVWVEDGDYLKAIEVVTGIYDSLYSELASGDLIEGQPLVTGTKVKNE